MSMMFNMKSMMNSEPLKFSEIKADDDVYTLEKWLERVECGGFIDYDGHGRYAKDGKVSNRMVEPSDLKAGKIDRSFTHVVWYNR